MAIQSPAPELTLESCRIAFENEVERSRLRALGSLPTDTLVELILKRFTHQRVADYLREPLYGSGDN